MWRRQITNTHNYIITNQLCNLQLNLDAVKKHLNIGFNDLSQDSYLNEVIRAAVEFAERQLNLYLLTTDATLHIDNFLDICIPIRRRPNVTIVQIDFFKDGVLTTVDAADYFLTVSQEFYPTVQPVEGKDWPTPDCRKQAVQIKFQSGYGATFDAVPIDPKLAFYNHIADMFENRGDCSEDTCSTCLPATTKRTYNSYKVPNIEIC